MKFAIRDDDICFHTNADALEHLYQDIIVDCPVSFGVIPFVGGFDYAPDSAEFRSLDEQWRRWDTRTIQAIDNNQPLIKLLRSWIQRDQASIMLHGIHHSLYEFTENKQFNDSVRQAKNHLESVFNCEIRVSTAPNNSLNAIATRAIANNQMNIITAFGHRPMERPLSVANFKNFIQLLSYYFKYKRRINLPYPLNFKSHFEQSSYTLGPNSNMHDLEQGLEYSRDYDGNYVLATHYYHLLDSPQLIEHLTHLMTTAKTLQPAVEFTHCQNLF